MTEFARTLQGGVQILIVFVIPLVIYFRRWDLKASRIVTYVLAVYAIWFLSYSPTHEGAHLAGGLLAGLDVQSYQLLPPFWRGDFVHGYIAWRPGGRPGAMLVSTVSPYLFDGLLLGVWAFAMRWADRGPLIGALILSLTALRCVYDVGNNYFADTVFGGRGDVEFLLLKVPPPAVHAGAWALMLGGAACAMRQVTGVSRRTVSACGSGA